MFRISKHLNALMSISLLLCSSASAQTQNRAQLIKEVENLREQIGEREKQLFLPDKADQEKYAEFLQQPNTGLVRLLPREKYDGVLKTRGGGAYYSFTRLTHKYDYGSDIALEQNYFSVGFAGAAFGFLVALGDVPLESVDLEHAGVKFLANYIAPEIEADARKQVRLMYPFFAVGDWKYTSRVPADVNKTYALRSIYYDTSDTLVIFRAVRKDESDGSIILLWKELKRFPTPKLIRQASDQR